MWIARASKKSHEAATLAHLIERLRQLHPAVPAEVVEATVRAEYDRLTKLKDRTFVPVLVEQASKIKLAEFRATGSCAE